MRNETRDSSSLHLPPSILLPPSSLLFCTRHRLRRAPPPATLTSVHAVLI
jgi:hypothetical protein